jgi:hypothetical protein
MLAMGVLSRTVYQEIATTAAGNKKAADGGIRS